MKRIFDIALSGLGLLFSAPLWLIISIAIKLEDRGKIILTQNRVGKNSKLFRAYKFRSMVPGAEKMPPVQATEHDPRVTKVGRVLRATAMDELPQLLNIFLGDMSFVGPRALLPSEVEVHGNNAAEDAFVEELFRRRSAVTPGLTGIAQIFAPRDVPRRNKFRYDLLYIRRRSFLFDVKLIFLSFWITLRGKWEHRGNKIQ